MNYGRMKSDDRRSSKDAMRRDVSEQFDVSCPICPSRTRFDISVSASHDDIKLSSRTKFNRYRRRQRRTAFLH